MCVSKSSTRDNSSSGEEAVSQSAGPCSEGSVAPPRGQEGKESRVGMGGVPKDAARSMQVAFPLDISDGRKWSPCVALGMFHHPLRSPVLKPCAQLIYQTVMQFVRMVSVAQG